MAKTDQKKPKITKKRTKNAQKSAPKTPKIPVQERNQRLATLAEIADEHSVEKRTVNIWVKKHGCPREDRGLYSRKAVNQWKEARHEKELELARIGGEDEKAARARLVAAQADMVEHKLGQMRGEYIRVDDAVFIMSNAAIKANFEFDEIPKSSAVRVIGMETIEDIEHFLREQINGAKIRVGELGDQAKVFAKRYSTDLVMPETLDAEGDLDNLAVGGKRAHAAHRTVRAQRQLEKHATSKIDS